MKRINQLLPAFVIVFSFLLSSCGGDAQSNSANETTNTATGEKAPVLRNVSASDALSMASDKNYSILDVRTAQEFEEGHLPDAINIDVLSASFETEVSKLDKAKPWLVYCRSGHRSAQATDAMVKLNFLNLSNMVGGISNWNGPVTK